MSQEGRGRLVGDQGGSDKISQNFTNFRIHDDCVAMETESCLPNKEFDISVGLFVYAVLHKHY